MNNTPRVTVPVDVLRELIDASSEVRDLLAKVPEMQDRKYVGTGNRFVNAIGAAQRSYVSAAPAPEGGAFDGESDGDTPLQAAAREAGWALSSMIDSAPWERRGQLQRIVERLGSAIDRLVWPWPGDDDRHDQIRAAWRAYADDHADDDGKIDVTEVDTCVSIACMKTIQLLSPALATREEAPAEAGEEDGLFLLMKRGLYYRPNAMGYTGIKDHAGRYTKAEAENHADPISGVTAIAAIDAPDFSPACFDDLARAHLAKKLAQVTRELSALRAQPPAREDAQPFGYWVEHKSAENPVLIRYGSFVPASDHYKITTLYTHPAPDALRVAVSDIAAERQRQVDAEGWSADRDDGYADAELAKSAAAYTLSACGFSPDAAREMWPRSWSAHWWKPTTARRDLVKAGALIVAEIERLDRQALAALQAEQKGGAA